MDIKLLKEICETPGISGFESPIRNLIKKEIEGYADEITIDGIGNLIALKKGKTDRKVVSTAHMDEIGFIVKHIDDKGFIRVHTIGGFDPKTLTAQRVMIHGKEDVIGVFGCKPIHLMTPEERGKKMAIEDYYIETGYDGEKVKEMISIGDPISRYQTLIEMGDCINSKSLDNRISVYALIEVLKALKEPPFDFYAVFCVQEEIGLRGAIVAGHHINPEFCINLDTTIAFDGPMSKEEERVSALGKGTAIKIMDSSVICDYRMVAFMKQTADENKIEWQPEILPRGGTDTAGIQRMGMDGVICGAISIPTRNIHQSVEMVSKADVKGSIDLLKACVEQIDQYDWEHK